MIQPPASMTRAWMTVALLWPVACLNYLDRIMLTTMRESVVAAIPMTEAQFGLLTSVFLWVYGLLSPAAGFLADKFNRAWIIIGSLFVWSAVTWLTGHAKSFEQLLAARALMGISEACYIPAALALIADFHRGPTRSFATGLHMTGIFVGSALGGMGGVIAEKHDWTHAFSLFGLLGIGYAIFTMFLLREAPRENLAEDRPQSTGFSEALGSLFRTKPFYLILAFWGLHGLVGWALGGWLPTFLGEKFQLGQGAAGMSATGYLQTASLFGVILSGFIADRWSRKNTRARILVPVIGMFLAAPGILLAATTNVFYLAIFGLMLNGFSRVFADANLMPIVCQVVDSRYRATAYGVLNMFACVIGGITIYAGGALRDSNLNLSLLFQICTAALVLCGVLLIMVKPTVKTNPS